MCMSVITKLYNEPLDDVENIENGWKVISINPHRPESWSPIIYLQIYPFNEWIVDKKQKNIKADDKKSTYLCGFHIFTNKQDAKKYCLESNDIVAQCKFKKVVARGKQRIPRQVLLDCVVAREIFIYKPEQ